MDTRAESGCCLLSHLFAICSHQDSYLKSSRSTSLRQIVLPFPCHDPPENSVGLPGFLPLPTYSCSAFGSTSESSSPPQMVHCPLPVCSPTAHSGIHPPASQTLPHFPVIIPPAHSKAVFIPVLHRFSCLDFRANYHLLIQLCLPHRLQSTV